MKKSSNLNLYQPLLCSRNLVSNKILVDYYFDNPFQLLITHDMSLIYIYIYVTMVSVISDALIMLHKKVGVMMLAISVQTRGGRKPGSSTKLI